MNDKLLDKWLNGTLSTSEMEAMKEHPVFMEYLKIDSFVKDLDLPAQDASEGLNHLKQQLGSEQKTKVIKLGWWLKVAAAAVIVLSVGYFYNASLSQDFSTQLAQTQTLQLPDNSQVILNENSHLSFKENNWDENRSLSLKGEAYFEVTKGAVFDVHTEHGTVTVLGTKFNVNDRKDSFEVVCYEGSVGVKFKNTYLKLSPGDKAVLRNDQLLSEKKYTTEPGWIHNESTFHNRPIEMIMEELKSVYDINIITKNIDVDLRYTGSFTNLDLEVALKTITLPLGLEYAIDNKNVTLFAKD
ncbi:MAG: FecR family protein [Bacteroidota bacterium]